VIRQCFAWISGGRSAERRTHGWAAKKESDRNVERSSLTRYAWLSIAAAIVTIGLKSLAYLMTGSVGLLSDAVESLVNLVAAIMALSMLIVAGLMDTSLPREEYDKVLKVLEKYEEQGVRFHALRTRQAAGRRFASIHVLVPGQWSTHEGHPLVENVEADIRHVLTGVTAFTHLEPMEDPLSFEDIEIDR
jgi:divalent metal cation (Fe/Co/Zn/Cd) transporter